MSYEVLKIFLTFPVGGENSIGLYFPQITNIPDIFLKACFQWKMYNEHDTLMVYNSTTDSAHVHQHYYFSECYKKVQSVVFYVRQRKIRKT